MKRLLPLLALLLILPLAGCNPEDVAQLKQQSSALREQADLAKEDYNNLLSEYRELVAAGATEKAASVLSALEDKADEIDTIHSSIISLDDKVQNAESGWDIAEGIVSVAAGFIPGIGVMLPIVRTFRRRFQNTVAAVSAAGGPKDPFAADRALDPKTKAAISTFRQKIGDLADRSREASPTPT